MLRETEAIFKKFNDMADKEPEIIEMTLREHYLLAQILLYSNLDNAGTFKGIPIRIKETVPCDCKKKANQKGWNLG